MPSSKRRLYLFAAVAVLLATFGAGCRGFFVNQPNSISVTQGGAPTLSVQVGSSVQLTATATFNSGTKDITKSAGWSSSTPCAKVSSTGLVNGIGSTSGVTITATSGGISGTISGSVTGGTSQALTISPQGPFTQAANPTVQFTATDSSNNNVTNSATWTSSNTAILTFGSGGPGFATLLAPGSTTVTASTASSGNSCASGSESVTIQ